MEYDIDFFNNLIKHSSNYYAHLSKDDEDKCPEYLAEHSSLTYRYARLIVDKNQLTPIIDYLVEDSIPSSFNSKNLLAGIIEKYFWRAIAFHDLGKVNKAFQTTKMRNKNADLLYVEHDFDTQHSIISMYIFLADFWREFINLELNEEERIFLLDVLLFLSYSICKHHSFGIENAMDSDLWANSDLFKLSPFLSLFNFDLNEKMIDSFHKYYLLNANFDFLFQGDTLNKIKEQTNSFPLFALIKLNYSLLTASDYLATSHYMNDWKELISDFGLIDDSLRNKIIENARTSKSYNKLAYELLDDDVSIDSLICQEKSSGNLNNLRQCIAIEVIKNIRKNTDKNLFYIEAPTGGGKTNVSMLAMSELLKNDKQHLISKVFYVFPFTTLITQTYASLKDTLELKESEIVEIHSKAAFSSGQYEDDYKNYIDYLFINFPVTLLSHIKFFDILKTNTKESNYLLHRLANSVVIIDELQSYSPQIWDKIIYFITNYAKYFNMKFILMSATLPKIGEILNDKDVASDFIYLIDDKNKYFQNPNFCERVIFNYNLLALPKPGKDNKVEYLNNLRKMVFLESEKYSKNNDLNPSSVFTIIEFIFKKTASDFYNITVKDNYFFDDIFLLSGTILEPQRRYIIEKLKSKEFRKKKVLLISTQVVEAGVDIDMDLGFKDKSLIDSEEQLAGRINRNVKKKGCQIFIFNCDEEKSIYQNDARFTVMKTLNEEYQNILKSKDFDSLYRLIIERIKQKNNCPQIANLSDLTDKISLLDYKGVNDELNIIQTVNVSVFVPLSIPIEHLGRSNDIIKEFDIKCHDGFIDGKDVWELYETIVQNGKENFIHSRLKLKKIQGLMSNFTFSIFPKGKDYNSLKDYGMEKLGYLYLESYKDIYSYKDGIDCDKFKDSNFL